MNGRMKIGILGTSGEVMCNPLLVAQPLDTTGGGDGFNAGCLGAWLKRRDLSTCLRWGNTADALSTLGHGGTGMRATRAEMV
jgi:sugar/nucleoside kinase (ribokinase family)